MANNGIEKVELAADGDLILLVKNTLELKLHVFALTFASPVFKKMLGPSFAEGRVQGTSASPKRLELRDDAVEGMRLLCYITYDRQDLMQNTPPQRSILELAIVANKYQCKDKVQLPIEAWMSRASHSFSRGQVNLVHAAHVLNNAEYFHRFTKDWVGEMWIEDPTMHLGDAIPNKIQDAVKARAETALQQLKDAIVQAIEALLMFSGSDFAHYRDNENCREPSDPANSDSEMEEYGSKRRFVFEHNGRIPPKCDYRDCYVLLQLRALADQRIWPPSNQESRLKELIAAVKDFKVPHDESIKPCIQRRGPCNDESDPVIDFRKAFRKTQRLAASLELALCLDCFKAGGRFDGICRKFHKK